LFKTTTGGWEDSPEAPEPTSNGVTEFVAGSGKVVTHDSVFDVHTRTWSPLHIPKELIPREGKSAVWAGDRLMLFGGVTVAQPYADSTLHADLWQWTPGG
jgi:hypothetical protein